MISPSPRKPPPAFRFVLAVAVSAAAVWGAIGLASAASDELARAKDLYHTAAYDEALTILNGVPVSPAGPDTLEVLEYRVLCLVALDRKEEAQRAIAALVKASPQYRMSELQSPRVRALFTEVRRSLLPSIVQQAYADAKAAFERKDPDAARQFDFVLTLLKDPDVATDPVLADLATVATGFRDLSKAAAPAAPPPPAVSAAARPAAVPVPASSTIVPPVAISQTFPPLQVQEPREWDGEIELVINEAGKVASARMRKSIHPLYDAQLLRAAKNWTYKPALKDGVPAQMVKVVGIHLDSRPECAPQRRGPCRPAAQ